MSKRTVVITLEIDATEYHEAENTAQGTIDLAIEMLRGDADLPDTISIECEGTVRTTNNSLD